MKITLHQLRIFQAVAEYQSVTIAARHLHMTQPAVSNIIRQLQDHYDCELIEVIGRQLSLTPFGTALLEHCKTIENTLAKAQTDIQELMSGISGTIHVASVTTAKYFLPHLLGSFKQNNPNIHIKFTVCNREEIILRLQKNLDDFVIMSHPPSTLPVDCADFYDDELIIIASPEYKHKPKPTHLRDLIDAPWIIREAGSGTRFATERSFKKYRFKPFIEMEIGDNEAIKQAVMANMGISIVSAQSVKEEIKTKRLKQIKIDQFPLLHKWYLVINKGKSLTPIANEFYTFVHAHSPRFYSV